MDPQLKSAQQQHFLSFSTSLAGNRVPGIDRKLPASGNYRGLPLSVAFQHWWLL